jgi:acyl-CoA reductase-like NAD-dependent aldehyde dehydrogenase
MNNIYSYCFLPVYNPSTGEKIGCVPDMNIDDTEKVWVGRVAYYFSCTQMIDVSWWHFALNVKVWSIITGIYSYRFLPVYNPSTGEKIGCVPDMNIDDTEKAIQYAAEENIK